LVTVCHGVAQLIGCHTMLVGDGVNLSGSR
jgi:hypothetical protein